MRTSPDPGAPASTGSAGPGCEALADGLLAEPVSAVSSLAFVLAAVAILVLAARGPGGQADDAAATTAATAAPGHRRLGHRAPGHEPPSHEPPSHGLPGHEPPGRRERPGTGLLGYALLVAAVGVGSVIQHGPAPAWSDVVHDAPLVGVLLFVAADAVADLTGRPRRWWWWVLPGSALLVVVVGAPRAGDLAQAGAAGLAIALTLARARVRPDLRRRIWVSLGLLAFGAAIGTLSRAGGPLCYPDSAWQGHAVWHVLASASLLVLAPVIGRRGAG